MNQDKLMKRRMIIAYILLGITVIALIVFIGLYIDETQRVQETYRKQYRTELGHVVEEIDIYSEAEGDRTMIFNRIANYMGNAGAFAFLLEDFEESQIIINETATALIKYPEQMSEKLEDLKTAVNDILADLDKGYDEAQEIVKSLDLKGY
ncbi:MAG: hypothetical protein IJ561_04950 [Ruminococcus sp.]|nr:hypothetical protein [Ruminococcus sp.]